MTNSTSLPRLYGDVTGPSNVIFGDNINESPKRQSNSYGDTHVGGRATAFLGDVHGGVNIQNATLLLSSNPADQNAAFHPRVERHYRFLPDRTIEIITTYDESITIFDVGPVPWIELHWRSVKIWTLACLVSCIMGNVATAFK